MVDEQKLIEMWLDEKSPTTKQSYRLVIDKLTNFCDKSLKEITYNDMFDFKISLQGMSANSVKLYVNTIKSLFRFGYKQGYFATNHADQLQPPKVNLRFDHRMLTEQEVSAIITHTTRQRDALLIRLLYNTGMRVSEICSLKWKNFKPGTDNCAVTFTGKGSKDRTIYFSLTLWQEMQQALGDMLPESPVFRSQKGGHLDPSQAWRIVQQAAARAGVEGNVSPHWFRHSHATHALQNGASLIEVRDTLGHSNIGVTDRYLHSRPGKSSSSYLKI